MSIRAAPNAITILVISTFLAGIFMGFFVKNRGAFVRRWIAVTPGKQFKSVIGEYYGRKFKNKNGAAQ